MQNTALIRQICGEITRETDEQKIAEFLLLLNAVILNDLEGARIRMEYIGRKYAILFGKTASDNPNGES